MTHVRPRSRRTRFIVLSTFTLASIATPFAFRNAWASEGTSAEIAALRARLDQLEAIDRRERAAQVDVAVASATRDAARRDSAFLIADGTAGYDKGFYLRSADGAFTLKPGLQWQYRYVATFRDEDAGAGIDDGFENRRLWFRFDGNAFGPDLTYSAIWETSRSNGALSLMYGYGEYRFASEWSVKFGQFKESVFQERNVSSMSQLSADRSLLDAVLGHGLVDPVQGVSLIRFADAKPVRVELTLHDGAGSQNTDFRGPPENASRWGAGARVECKALGTWANYKDFTARGTQKDLLVVGAGADVTDRAGDTVVRAGVDAQFENAAGLSLFAAANANYVDARGAGASTDAGRVDWGGLVQVGYLVRPDVELFGRYSYVRVDVPTAAGDNFSELTVGATYYFGKDGTYGHRAKLTADLNYLPQGVPSDQTGLGELSTGDAEFVLRVQSQLQL